MHSDNGAPMTPYTLKTQRHRGVDAELLAKHEAVSERAKSLNSWSWSGDTRNWKVTGAVSLNPGKLQKIERIKQVLKRSYLHNWVANHRNATDLKNARPDAEVLIIANSGAVTTALATPDATNSLLELCSNSLVAQGLIIPESPSRSRKPCLPWPGDRSKPRLYPCLRRSNVVAAWSVTRSSQRI
jgi:hypothetical protein